MKMYGFDDNDLPRKYITIAYSSIGAYQQFIKKGIKAELNEIFEIETTVVMIYNPKPGLTSVVELKNVNNE